MAKYIIWKQSIDDTFCQKYADVVGVESIQVAAPGGTYEGHDCYMVGSSRITESNCTALENDGDLTNAVWFFDEYPAGWVPAN